jgi:hypothetical protein
VRPVPVGVLPVDTEDVLEVAAAEDEDRSRQSARSVRTRLGLGSGDRFEAFRDGSGPFKGRVLDAKKPARLRGKRAAKRPSSDHIAAGRSLHGKEGVDGSSPSEGLFSKKYL